jgi:L-ribulokinase
MRQRLFADKTYTCDVKVGTLSAEWANRLGLTTNVAVGAGAFDAHLGAVGAEIKPYQLIKVMGTSTCDMLIAPAKDVEGKLVKGICGQVDGSIIPGMVGLEAGQSAFGDVYAWFKKLIAEPVEGIISQSSAISENDKKKLIDDIDNRLIAYLSDEASKINPEESTVIALDWMNGRRTPDANQLLKGVIAGINLGSDAASVFRALVESTAFGAKKIVDRFISEGVKIESVIAIGGVAKKSPFVMQTLADVLNMPIKVVVSDQACALGTAMAAAVVGGAYKAVEDAQKAMGSGFEKTYVPNADMAKVYSNIYQKYSNLAELLEPAYNKGKI